MKVYTLHTIFLFLLLTVNAFAQPVIQWQNTIGGGYSDVAKNVEQTSDGGYIVGGYSSSVISGDKTEASLNTTRDFWVLKLSSTGSIEWQNTIGGENDDNFAAVQQTSDGGYILGGSSSSPVSGEKTEGSMGSRDYWVIKLNSTGTIEWQNVIGGNQADDLTHLLQTADGGCDLRLRTCDLKTHSST